MVCLGVWPRLTYLQILYIISYSQKRQYQGRVIPYILGPFYIFGRGEIGTSVANLLYTTDYRPIYEYRHTTGPHGISCSTRSGTGVPESTRSGIRPASSSPSVVVIYTSTTHPAISSVNYWPSIVSCRSIHLLEHSSSRCSIITFRLNFSATAKVISVPPVLS